MNATDTYTNFTAELRTRKEQSCNFFTKDDLYISNASISTEPGLWGMRLQFATVDQTPSPEHETRQLPNSLSRWCQLLVLGTNTANLIDERSLNSSSSNTGAYYR